MSGAGVALDGRLDSLADKYRRNRSLLFPKGRLPSEFSDLHPQWAELDGFVSGLAERALAGEMLRPEEVEPFGYAGLRRLLEVLKAEHPDIAEPYLALFDHLDEMLNILRAISQKRGETN